MGCGTHRTPRSGCRPLHAFLTACHQHPAGCSFAPGPGATSTGKFDALMSKLRRRSGQYSPGRLRQFPRHRRGRHLRGLQQPDRSGGLGAQCPAARQGCSVLRRLLDLAGRGLRQLEVRAADRYTGPFTIRPAHPLLVVGVLRDPATRYADAVSLSQLSPGARLPLWTVPVTLPATPAVAVPRRSPGLTCSAVGYPTSVPSAG